MGPFRNLGYSAYFYRAMNAQTAGTTTVNGSSIDMLASFGGAFDCVCFICALNTLIATQQTILKVQGSLDNSTWTGTGGDIGGSHQGPPQDADSNKLLIVDGYRYQFRYLRPVVVRGTANAAIDAVIGIAYNAHSYPVTTQDTTVSTPQAGGSGMVNLPGADNQAGPYPVNVVTYGTLGTA